MTDSGGRILTAGTFETRRFEQPLTRLLGLFAHPPEVVALPAGQIFAQLLACENDFERNVGGVNIVLIRASDWVSEEHVDPISAALAMVDETIVAVKALAHRKGIPHLVCVTPSAPHPLEKELDSACWERVHALADSAVLHACLLDHTTLELPKHEVIDPALARLPVTPYSSAFIAQASYAIARAVHAWRQPPRKVIAVDCDNTLWRGRCGEDGTTRLIVDEGRQAVLDFLIRKQQEGFLIVIVSRNSESDVAEALAYLQSTGVRFPRFVARRVNWESKSDNLKSLSNELGLAIEHFVVLDDDPAECAEMLARSSVGVVARVPVASSEAKRFISRFWACDSAHTTEADRSRLVYLEREQARQLARPGFQSYAAYLESLQLSIEVREATEADHERIVQLLHRTTQFNTSGLKCGLGELRVLLQRAETTCLVTEVTDRFGEYGLVGAALVTTAAGMATCDCMVLSCRALNRGAEEAMLVAIATHAQHADARVLKIPVYATERNVPASRFFERVIQSGIQCALPTDTKSILLNVDAIIDWSQSAARIVAEESSAQTTDIRAAAPAAAALQSQAVILQHQRASESDAYQRLASDLADPDLLIEWLGLKPSPAACSTYDSFAHRERTHGSDPELRLRSLWAAAIGTTEFDDDDDFFDLGADSFTVVELLCAVETMFGIDMEFAALFLESFTFERFASLVSERLVASSSQAPICAGAVQVSIGDNPTA